MNEPAPPDLVAQLAGDLDHATQHILGLFDVPAYIRRALRVEEAIRSLDAKVLAQRTDMLIPVRHSHARWEEVCRRYPRWATWPTTSDQQIITELPNAWANMPPIRVIPLLWPIRPKRLFADLSLSIQQFNQRWHQWIHAINLARTNALIDDYNRHYLIEKECAFRSTRAAGRGFLPKAPIEREPFLLRYPFLREISC
ncbi:hypothetical protein K2X85_15930 [bacterium]|nr:hypothetical protein [bacterium]